MERCRDSSVHRPDGRISARPSIQSFLADSDDPSGCDTDRHRWDKLVECRANAFDVSGPPDGLSRRPHRACDILASIQNLSWVALNLPLAALTGLSDRSRDIFVPLLASESVRAQLGLKGQH